MGLQAQIRVSIFCREDVGQKCILDCVNAPPPKNIPARVHLLSISFLCFHPVGCALFIQASSYSDGIGLQAQIRRVFTF